VCACICNGYIFGVIKWLHYPSHQCLSRQRTQRVHVSILFTWITFWLTISFYFLETKFMLECNDRIMNQTFGFYYHGSKCKWTFNHINFVNKIPSHNKRFKPLYKLHEINTTTTFLPKVKFKVHKVVILKSLEPQQTMLPSAIDVVLLNLYLSIHFEAFALQSFHIIIIHLKSLNFRMWM